MKESDFIDEARVRQLLTSPPDGDFQRALRAVLKNCRGKELLTLSQVAELANVSVRSLQRRLDEAGVTFSSLVTEARRELAMNLLRNTSLSLQEIASELGYSKSNNFARAFKSWTGQTPAEFRGVDQN